MGTRCSSEETIRRGGSTVSSSQLGIATNPQNKRDLVEHRTASRLLPVGAIGSSSERNSMARKRYQKGQLWLEEDGWHGRWREDVIVDGIRKRPRREEVIGALKEFPTKRLAQRALDERIAYVNKITYRPMPSAKFKDFADSWVKKVLSQYGPSTAVNYRSHINKHLVPFFGQYAVREITPELVQAFVSSSRAAPKTTKNICVTLQSMWRAAKAWGYSSCDVMAELVLPTPKRAQRFFFSQQEVRVILSAADEPYRTFYGLLAETGMRVGELCGLCVEDLDLVRGLLQVRQSAVRGKLGDPKTDESIRVIELSPHAVEHLKIFLQSWQPNERRLLLATRKGTPWDQNLVLKRKFKPLLHKLGIKVPKGNGFHAFRHANATMMSSFGAPLKLRQQRLGHVDGSPVTETIYTHVISEDGKHYAAKLGKAVWGVLDASWTLKEKAGVSVVTNSRYIN